ncbi:glycosyltransferase [Streptomyces orinoci]|uniref:Glycosyltransferase n=1 Tax=Streptomyces orinoci TaxID=67339 RepID=A0ABV3JVP9_STRON|nr:glycosyltransferase [Streptomyces orinoci]
MRIVQLANFYAPASGGLRTTLDALGRGYTAAGHQRVLVVPGPGHARVWDRENGLRLTLPGVRAGGGYRLLLSRTAVRRLLDRLAPDSLEVSDKLTLVHTAHWARQRGVRSVLFSHERLDAILAPRLPARLPLGTAAGAWNRRLAAAFDAVVVTSAFARAEFDRVPAERVHRVPLGVDLSLFAPRPGARIPSGAVRLVHCGRLSAEKSPWLAVETLRELLRRGVEARLHILGDGPQRRRLERGAAGLPVRFLGHLADRRTVAAITAAADVALAPCPVESFGLSALEALACGTPVVTADRGAARELLAPGAGVAVPASPAALADGVAMVLARPERQRRTAARRRAEEFPWPATVSRMLAVHSGQPPSA